MISRKCGVVTAISVLIILACAHCFDLSRSRSEDQSDNLTELDRDMAKTESDGRRSVEPSPKTVIEETEYDLGIIDRNDACEHIFVVQNKGQGPLRLTRGPTTCSCTMSDLPAGPIPPGGAAEVRVASKIDNKDGYFSHKATIFTNDPERDAIELGIQGLIKTCIGTDPPALDIAAIRPGKEGKEIDLCVYSHVWEDIEIEGVKSSLEHLTWEVEPAADDRLAKLSARCGKVLRVRLPNDMPSGPFVGWLDVQAKKRESRAEGEAVVETETAQGESRSKDKADSRGIRIALSGRVLGRLSVYGNSLDAGKIVRIGQVPSGRKKSERLILTVNDEHKNLDDIKVRTIPDFLDVKVEPYGKDNGASGLYRISVTVPSNAPNCSYLGIKPGRLQIETNHPHVPAVELEVAFAVVD